MTLRLHWSPDSANIVVRMALEELGLDYVGVRVDRAKAQHKSPAFLKLNPQGLIPVLEDGPIVLFETGAILLHLADKVGRLGPRGPSSRDAEARAAFLKWLFFLSNTLHADLRMAFYSDRYVDDDDAIPALRRGLATRFRDHATLIDEALAPTGWLAAGAPTLVDFYLAACLRWARLYPRAEPLVAGGDLPPRAMALLRALEARPAILRAYAAEHVTAQPLTTPAPADLPPEQVTG